MTQMSYRKHLRKRCHAKHNYFPSAICEQPSQIKASLKQRLQSKFICAPLYLECLPTFQLAVILRGKMLQIHQCCKQVEFKFWLLGTLLHRRPRAGEWSCLVCLFLILYREEQHLVVVGICCVTLIINATCLLIVCKFLLRIFSSIFCLIQYCSHFTLCCNGQELSSCPHAVTEIGQVRLSSWHFCWN